MSLILVDGSALVYRAYYAFVSRPLTAPDGEPTSVVFGFFNSVLRLVESQRPTHLAVAFDRKEPTFRHEMFREYKATRKPMPEDLAVQLPRLREVLAAWGVPILEKEGFEADDIMATAARRSDGVCARAWFYTGDKDFLQLLDERTGMLRPGRRGDEVSVVGPAEVQKQYGVEPARLPDIFALSGDSSDNIPGAPGIGEKTASKLIRQFGSLDELYARLEDERLTPRVRRILAESRDQVYLSRRLFIIDQDVPFRLDWPDLITRLPTGQQARRLLEELGLRRILGLVESLAARLGEPSPAGRERPDPGLSTVSGTDSAAPTEPEPDSDSAQEAGHVHEELRRRRYRIIRSEDELRKFIEKLPRDAPLAVDTETDGLRVDRARLVGISLAADGGGAVYLPVLWREPAAKQEATGETPASHGTLFGEARERSELIWVRRQLAPVLQDAGRLKVGQNLKFDEWILTRHGMPLRGPRFDTMVAAYVLDPGRQRYSLTELAADYLKESMIPYEDLFAPGDRRRDILTVPLLRLALYAAEDADVTFRLHRVLASALEAAGLAELFRNLEMPLSVVLFRMEHRGIKIDLDFLGELREVFARELERLEAAIQKVAGESFNVQSSQQLAHILFDKLGLKPLKKTATGWSTDVSVLKALAEKHPLPGLVLEHRQLAKLQGTYVESLPELVEPETALIHTSFNQAVAATGRLSSSDPNLQNIPVRTELGRSIRRAFVPRVPDHSFVSADYSQIELRLLAHLSGDAALSAAFREGDDVHRRTAALIAGVEEAAVTGEMRSRAKAINFGVIYGMGAPALARQIAVTTREARAFIDTYFATYPGVKSFIDTTKERARLDGYVETMLGRRRPLQDILSPNNRLRSFSERIAVNTPLQGTAADLIKLVMIRIDRELSDRELASLLLLQVHDELLLEVPHHELDEVASLVRDCMENIVELHVPLVVDIHVGANWAEAHG
jgi:DNA polymerase-1